MNDMSQNKSIAINYGPDIPTVLLGLKRDLRNTQTDFLVPQEVRINIFGSFLRLLLPFSPSPLAFCLFCFFPSLPSFFFPPLPGYS